MRAPIVDDIELGERAAAEIAPENAGLVSQRVTAITSRRRQWGWRIHYTNGVATSMSAVLS